MGWWLDFANRQYNCASIHTQVLQSDWLSYRTLLKKQLDKVFRDIYNYQGRSKCYQLKPKVEAGNKDIALSILEITKTQI